MATKNVGTLNWQTGVDLSGLRKDLKVAEQEVQKASKTAAGTGGGGTGGAGGGNSWRDMIRQGKSLPKVGKLFGSLEKMIGSGEGGANGGGGGGWLSKIPGFDKLSGMGAGGAASLAAPLAVMAYAWKRESESTKHFSEIAQDAKRFRMDPQSYANRVYGGLGVDNSDFQRAQWRSRESHQWGQTKETAKNWFGAQGGKIKDFLWGAARTPWEALENGRSGWTAMQEERTAADKEQAFFTDKYKRMSGLSKSGAAPVIENGMGMYEMQSQREVAVNQLWYQREALITAKQLEAKFGVKVAEGPA